MEQDNEEMRRLKTEVEFLRAEAFEARVEADGARRRLAEESKEIELIKREMTVAVSKVKAEAEVEKANLAGKAQAVDKMKQKYEMLQAEIEVMYKKTAAETEEMRRRAKDEADRTRCEADADAQDLLKKSLKEIQMLKGQPAVTNDIYKEAEKQLERSKQQVLELEKKVMQQQKEFEKTNGLMAEWVRQTDQQVDKIQHCLATVQTLVVKSTTEPAYGDVDKMGRLDDDIGKYLSSIQVPAAAFVFVYGVPCETPLLLASSNKENRHLMWAPL